MRRLEGRVALITGGGGEMTVQLPETIAVNLSASANAGNLRFDFPRNRTFQEVGNSIDEQISGGGPQLRLENAGVGDVHIIRQ